MELGWSPIRWPFVFLLTLTIVSGVAWGYARRYRKQFPEKPVSFWLDTLAGSFPIFCVVFMVRTWIAEPFRIPSGSMEPSLRTGDFVLVNKLRYGVRAPLSGNVWWKRHTPQRGEILVFHYPKDPQAFDYIKRVVGVPGDTIQWRDHQLHINGQPVDKRLMGGGLFWNAALHPIPMQEYQVCLPRPDASCYAHRIYERVNAPANPPLAVFAEVTVPPDHYFVLGDNRDDSGDSRFWGFVPDRYIMGRAEAVWLSVDWQRYRLRFGRWGWVDNLDTQTLPTVHLPEKDVHAPA